MQEIFANFTNPSWLMSSVFMAFLMSLLASYAKPIADRIGSKISSSYRASSKKRQQEFDAKVAELFQNSTLEINYKLDAIYFTLQAIFGLGLAFGLLQLFPISKSLSSTIGNPLNDVMTILAPICLLIALVAVIASLSDFSRAVNLRRIVRTASKQKQLQQNPTE